MFESYQHLIHCVTPPLTAAYYDILYNALHILHKT